MGFRAAVRGKGGKLLEDLARLIAAVEATGRRVSAVKVTHPNGLNAPTHYFLSFWPQATTLHNSARQYGGSDRIWGRDVAKLLGEIGNFPTIERQG